MADIIYNSCRQRMLAGTIDWVNDNIKAVLVSAAYTVDLAHSFYSDLTGIVSGPIAVGSNVTRLITSDGAASAPNITFTAVSGNTIIALVIFSDTGTPSTSPLWVYLDSANGLPFSPIGEDIPVRWSTGVNKIFRP